MRLPLIAKIRKQINRALSVKLFFLLTVFSGNSIRTEPDVLYPQIFPFILPSLPVFTPLFAFRLIEPEL